MTIEKTEDNSEMKKSFLKTGVKSLGGVRRKNVISEEAAIDQINIFMDYYDFDPKDHNTLEDLLEDALKRLLKAVRRGYLEIGMAEDNLVIKQKLTRPPGSEDTLIYKVLTGRSKMAMDKKKATETQNRIYSLVGALTGVGAEGIKALSGIDLSVAESLGFIFLYA
jgi:hypothetical protein